MLAFFTPTNELKIHDSFLLARYFLPLTITKITPFSGIGISLAVISVNRHPRFTNNCTLVGEKAING
jgi:hypothetical protein